MEEEVYEIDVNVRGEILKMLREVKKEEKKEYILIKNDIGVEEKMEERIEVMENGRIVEWRKKKELIEKKNEKIKREMIEEVKSLERLRF